MFSDNQAYIKVVVSYDERNVNMGHNRISSSLGSSLETAVGL